MKYRVNARSLQTKTVLQPSILEIMDIVKFKVKSKFLVSKNGQEFHRLLPKNQGKTGNQLVLSIKRVNLDKFEPKFWNGFFR